MKALVAAAGMSVLAALVLAPGLVASPLPHTPPPTGTRCEDVYSTHVELSGDSWCDVMPCNGARCYHLGRTLHFHGWEPWAVCGCF